ncbi:MAG: hypothetical protein RLZZ597_1250 [Cyanobacteriota bacterium]
MDAPKTMSNLAKAAAPLHQDLSGTIIRDPITVFPHTTVREAIALMSGARAHCDTQTANPSGDPSADQTVAPSELAHVRLEARASCAIVLETYDSPKVIGILTERDVVRLCANQQSLEALSVGQAMTSPVLTLPESSFTDLFSVINVLQQHHIRHLPIVEGQGDLVGLLTHETLRQVLQPTDLLRLRLVQEVMTPKVITVAPTDALLKVAQCMATQRVSSVVVVGDDSPGAAPVPVGIVTERDLVQFQALELAFERYTAAQVMSHPAITVPETDTLLTVQQLMKRHLIRRLVAVGEAGELRGIVTQTNVLQALNPLELYKLTEVLEAQVKQLETEKVELLESRNLELAKEVASRTDHLQKQLQREQVVAHLASQIRSSLSLQTILDAAVEQIRQMIGCDRVNIWKFEPDWSTVVVAESAALPPSLMGERVHDRCYQQYITQVYSQGHVRAVSDIYATEMTDCHRELLIRLQTRAKVLLPLFCGEELWGLLNVAESTRPRDWQPDEIEMLRHLTTQLTIAIQQASIHEKLHTELQERHHIETQLRQSTERLQEAQRIAHLGDWELDLQHNTLHWSDEVFRIFEIDPQGFGASYEDFLNLVHPADRPTVNDTYTQHLRDRQPYNVVHRLQMADGRIKYVREQCETSFSADGTPLLSRGTVQDITQQQEAEMRRDRAEASLRQVIEGTAAFTGQEFFPALVRHIAEALGIRYVVVSQAVDEGFQVLAFYADGELRPPLFLPYEAVPCCHQSFQTGRCRHPANLQALYPDHDLFAELDAESYLGVGLRNAAGEATGNLCILHDRPLVDPVWTETLLSIFAARAGAELERLVTAQALEQLNADLETRVAQRTAELAERETLLQDFLDNANDLIQMVDVNTGRFEFVNRAWREVLGYTAADVDHLTLFDVLAPHCIAHCQQVLEQMRAGTLTQLEQVELTFIHQSGQPVVVEGSINCRVDVDAQGNQRPVSTRAILRDITAKKAAEQALRATEAKYRQIIETAQEGIWTIDADGKHQFGNDALLRMLGYTAEEMEGRSLFDFFPPSLHPHIQDLLQRRQSGFSETNELPLLRRDGTTLWTISSATPLFDEAGHYVGVMAMITDITDRKLAEEAIQAENAFRNLILENLAEGLCVCHACPDFPFVQFTVWNPQMEVITGYTQAEINELGWYQTLYPDPAVRDQAIARMNAMRAGDHILSEEWIIRHRDGSNRTLSIATSLLPTADGPANVLAVMQDITDRRQAEQERQRLLQELAGFKLGLDEAAIVAITDASGVITYVNQRFVEISGYSEAEAIGQTHRLVNSNVHPPSFFADLWNTIQQGKTWRGEVCNRAKDGNLYWVSSTIVPFLDMDGKPERYLAVRFDITARRQSQLLLQENLQLLQGITQAQSQFITAQNRLEIFEGLLATLLDFTDSEYGFIGEVLFREDGTATMEESFMKIRGVPYLKAHSITNIAWDEITQKFYEDNYEQGMEFTNMSTLFGATIMTGKPVIANSPSTDSRRGGIPHGHPPLNAFLGLPFYSGSTLIGMVGIANRPGGYTEDLVTTLNPLLVTCSNLIEGYRQDRLRRVAETALQESRQFLQTVLDTVPLRVFWKDVNSTYLGANQRFLRDAGLREPTELVGKDDFDLPWNETEAELYRADDHAVIESGEARLGILETQHQQGGGEIWVETSKLPLRNLAGEIIGILGTYQDVTDRRNAELALQRQLAAIEAAVDGIAILQDGQYLYLNSSHAKMFGYESAADLIGQGWAILYSPEELERFDREVFPVLLEQKSWQGEATATRKDGTTFPEQLSLTFAADNLLICVCQDISDRKAAEAELRRTNTELERATRLKDEFLANMSHELRTPLNAILGMTEGLQEEVFGIVNERQLYALGTVEKSANHLLALINDILDVAKIESGQITLDCTYVSIDQICASSLAFVKQQAFKKNIQLNTEIPAHLPEIWVDEIRMRQVLLNLLNNAVKFTLEGGIITLRVSQVPPAAETSGPPFLRLTIEDTGIGIAPENIAKLFKPFVQIDSALNRKQTGTGLGLALVKQIVELHGGQVKLTSELGVGSCFAIELPYVSQARPDAQPTDADNPDDHRPNAATDNPTPAPSPLVLLAEDNPANVATISCYLEAKGYRLVHANDGEEAIDLALSHNPDLILMDIQMPGMDGLEAMRLMRLQERLAETPIIALTALAMKHDRERCLAAGANAYLSKPIRLKQLDTTIRALLLEHPHS